jgi:PAS domain S-box-containing protein
LTVRHALNERDLREELEGARKALRHSQSLYRALVDNPAYGIYRCDDKGKILDVNQALVNMLAYSNKEAFLAANSLIELLSHVWAGSTLAERSGDALQIEPIETEWKRKNGTMLKVRISGRGIFDDHGNFANKIRNKTWTVRWSTQSGTISRLGCSALRMDVQPLNFSRWRLNRRNEETIWDGMRQGV